MTDKEITQAAREWVAAKNTGKPARRLSIAFPGASEADAYSLQFSALQLEKESGEALAGRKIAFTADKMRAAFGLREPAFGYMLKKDVHTSGFELADKRFASALLEPEIAFSIGKDLDADNISREELKIAVSGVFPAFEVVTGRIGGGAFCLADIIADDASFGCAVQGNIRTPLSCLDLSAVTASVFEDGAAVAEGSGAGVMGNPLEALFFLAKKLRSFGTFLKKGEIVLSGSLTKQIPTSAAKTYLARFSGLGEVSVTTL